MSKFFTGGSSSEEDDLSDVVSTDEESEEEDDFKPNSKFMGGDDSDSEDDDKPRVVKSAQDKRLEVYQEALKSIRNHMKINDWVQLANEFEKVQKAAAKSLKSFFGTGSPHPKLYIKAIVLLIDFHKKALDEKASSKFNKLNAKSFNAMKQKLSKVKKDLEKEIKEYRNNPLADEDEIPQEDDDDFDEDEEDEEDDEDDDDEKPKKSKKKVEKQAEEQKKPEEPKELSHADIRKKIKEIVALRGLRNAEPYKQVEKLTSLLEFLKDSEDPKKQEANVYLRIEIRIHILAFLFDTHRSIASAMPVKTWKDAMGKMHEVIQILESNPTVVFQEAEDPEQEVIFANIGASAEDIPIDAKEQNEDEGAAVAEPEQAQMVGGNLMSFTERLDDELTKSLQASDPHSSSYLKRLADEFEVLDLSKKVQAYYTRSQKPKHCARIAQRRIEHIYYRPSTQVTEADLAKIRLEDEPSSIADLIELLANLVYQSGTERHKTRTLLCQVYYKSLHDNFHDARDMLLMSHLQESINHMDPPTLILFNRAMVQLGMCAFRAGMIKQAHRCLAEMYLNPRIKELLAQGTGNKYHDRTPEQEKIERKRQLPFHMHINLELIEAVHWISAMLLEVPFMASNAFDVKKNVISKPFRRLLDITERNIFNGPPENLRELMMAAARSLMQGDWQQAETYIFSLTTVWNLMSNADEVKKMVSQKLKEEGLRTYLFSYGKCYDSFLLVELSELFSLPEARVHQIVSRMMAEENFHGSWDQPSAAIIMHRVDPSRLQHLSVEFVEKTAQFVDNNERMLDTKTGGYNMDRRNYRGNQQGDRNQNNQQRNRGGYRNQGFGGFRNNQGGNNQFRQGNNQNYRQGGNNQFRQGNNQFRQGNNQFRQGYQQQNRRRNNWNNQNRQNRGGQDQQQQQQEQQEQ